MIRLGIAIVLMWVAFVAGRGFEGTEILTRLGYLLPQLAAVVTLSLVIRRFEWGERAMRPWVLLAVGAAILILSRVAGWAGYHGLVDEGLLVVSNLFNVAGVADCLLIVRSTGLLGPMSPRTRLFVYPANGAAIAAALVALLVVIQRAVDVGWTGEPGDWTRVAAVVLLLCDAVVFVLAVTLTASVWPLTGGLAVRPYLLIAASGATFLMLDLAGMLLVESWGYGEFGVVLTQISLAAWALFAGAGLAQVQVLRFVQR